MRADAAEAQRDMAEMQLESEIKAREAAQSRLQTEAEARAAEAENRRLRELIQPPAKPPLRLAPRHSPRGNRI